MAPIFDVIAYASRAFAVCYALQCAMAAGRAWRGGRDASRWRSLPYGILTSVMLATAAFGVPAETGSSS